MGDVEAANILQGMKRANYLLIDPVSEDMRNAAMILTELKKSEIANLECAASIILDLNDHPIYHDSNIRLHEIFEGKTLDEIEESSNLLIEYGILPPFENDAKMSGGGKTIPTAKTPIQSTRKSERNSPLSKKKKDYVSEKMQIKESLEKAKLKRAINIKRREEYNLFQEKLSETLKTSSVLKQLEDKKWETIDPFLQKLDICDENKGRASRFMNALFPTQVVSFWKDNLKKNCRDIYELTSVEGQCNNTIGDSMGPRKPVKEPPIMNDTCYICGFPLDPNINGLRPTCEHILPIIQAIFFLDLYRPSMKTRVLNNFEEYILSLEYDWAHECCNYVKSDISFLKTVYSEDENRVPIYWDYSTQSTNRVLTAILEGRSTGQNPDGSFGTYEGCDIIKAKIAGDSIPNWQLTREAYIRDQKMASIVEYINSRGNYGITMMIGFGNCLDQTKISEKFSELITQFEQKKPFSSMRSFRIQPKYTSRMRLGKPSITKTQRTIPSGIKLRFNKIRSGVSPIPPPNFENPFAQIK